MGPDALTPQRACCTGWASTEDAQHTQGVCASTTATFHSYATTSPSYVSHSLYSLHSRTRAFFFPFFFTFSTPPTFLALLSCLNYLSSSTPQHKRETSPPPPSEDSDATRLPSEDSDETRLPSPPHIDSDATLDFSPTPSQQSQRSYYVSPEVFGSPSYTHNS